MNPELGNGAGAGAQNTTSGAEGRKKAYIKNCWVEGLPLRLQPPLLVRQLSEPCRPLTAIATLQAVPAAGRACTPFIPLQPAIQIPLTQLAEALPVSLFGPVDPKNDCQYKPLNRSPLCQVRSIHSRPHSSRQPAEGRNAIPGIRPRRSRPPLTTAETNRAEIRKSSASSDETPLLYNHILDEMWRSQQLRQPLPLVLFLPCRGVPDGPAPLPSMLDLTSRRTRRKARFRSTESPLIEIGRQSVMPREKTDARGKKSPLASPTREAVTPKPTRGACRCPGRSNNAKDTPRGEREASRRGER